MLSLLKINTVDSERRFLFLLSLHLVMDNVEIEQVEMTKLLGVTLDCKLSWSKHIDTTVAKMGRSRP
jgi:hypothetical protein